MKKYTLELSEEHLQPLLKALDTFTRLQMGQFNTVFETFPELNWEDRDLVHKLIRQVVFKDMPLNGSLGVFSPELPMDAKVSYDIYQVIRHARAWDNIDKNPDKDTRDLSKMLSVDYDAPMRCSGQPLPKMHRKPEGSNATFFDKASAAMKHAVEWIEDDRFDEPYINEDWYWEMKDLLKKIEAKGNAS